MKLAARILGVVGVFILLGSIVGAEGQWQLIHSKDGIDTYKMTHPGTDVCTFKGVGFIDAKIEVIGEVMRDIPAYPEWMAKFKETTILKTIDRNTYIFHAVIKAPLPYANRDLVIENQTRYNFENGTALLTFGLAKNYNFPEQKGYYRLQELEGLYYLEYFGRDKTRVTYQYRSHPGGNIPVALANEIEIKHYPEMTIAGLRKMVKKSKYIKGGQTSPEYEMIERMLDNKNDVEKILKNRIGEYIIDPVLLNMLFEMTIPKRIVDDVYASRSDFASIRKGMVDLFDVVGDKALTGPLKQEVDALSAYLKNKNFDSFFSMQKFMGETWLVDEISRDKKLVRGLFEMESSLAKVIFEKATTSGTAVTSFIKDKKLAESILNNASLRKKLWEDQVLRVRLTERLDQFKSIRDFENLIRERVNSYSL
jgi:hypothetical protein